ncbi:MAG: hypothetical protein ACFE96_12625, partial [Candidatus Hermodarchaeota archaeon]
KFKSFLIEIKKYSSSDKDVSKIEEDLQSKLNIILQLHKNLKVLSLSSNLKEILANILPKSEYEWGILFSWLFIHQLGKVIYEKNYEIMSRSFFDEWRLTKYIRNTLNELATNEDEKNQDVGSIIKLMISHQNWSNLTAYAKKDFHTIFQSFFSDPEIQVYLKVNRYHNLLWYSAEEFATFLRWIWLTALIDFISKISTNTEKELQVLLNYYQRLEELSKASKYQVSKLLDAIERDF